MNPSDVEAAARRRISLVLQGIAVGTERVPLYAGSMHYFRVETGAWRPALLAMKRLGLRLVDTYVPWGVHEIARGEFDFGDRRPELDLARFLRTAHEIGLYVIVRPGPHINAELTCFGIPERVIWDPECQARSAAGKPVILPVPPLAFPVPSYASDSFQKEAAEWLRAFAAVVAPWVWPDGPVVLYQIDNEGAMYFRDGVYDQDYHPDALSAYRRFLERKYARPSELRAVYGEAAEIAALEPPKSFTAQSAEELAPHLDWAEFQEQLLADSFARMRSVLSATAFERIPCSHNLPLSEGATPLDPARLLEAVDFVGLDYYHGASPPQRAEIARRTSELAVRSELSQTPAFACELGAGFPPFFPPLGERDNAFTALTALAYGLRGFNVYMAVDRDRWIGAPINARGAPRPSSSFWQRLTAALERTQFHELRRHTPVQIIIPRSLRRLSRVLHAFGPLSAALFQVLGGSSEEACFEDELGLGAPVVIETQRFVRALEVALEKRRIPYAIAPGDLADQVVDAAGWTIVACSGALERELASSVRRAARAGKLLSVGPFAPERDAGFAPLLERALDLEPSDAEFPPLLSAEPTAIERAVDAAASRFASSRLAASSDSVFLTCHANAAGEPRVLFLINPTEHAIHVELSACGAASVSDALSSERLSVRAGQVAVTVPGRTVRMLELA